MHKCRSHFQGNVLPSRPSFACSNPAEVNRFLGGINPEQSHPECCGPEHNIFIFIKEPQA